MLCHFSKNNIVSGFPGSNSQYNQSTWKTKKWATLAEISVYRVCNIYIQKSRWAENQFSGMGRVHNLIENSDSLLVRHSTRVTQHHTLLLQEQPPNPNQTSKNKSKTVYCSFQNILCLCFIVQFKPGIQFFKA